MLSARYSLSSFAFELLLLLLCVCLLSRLNWFAFLQRKSVCFFLLFFVLIWIPSQWTWCCIALWNIFELSGGIVRDRYGVLYIHFFSTSSIVSSLFTNNFNEMRREREINTYRGWYWLLFYFVLWICSYYDAEDNVRCCTIYVGPFVVILFVTCRHWKQIS